MGASADPSASVDFIAGTVGGVASLLAGHPFDTIKTRLQSQSIPSSATSAPNGSPKPVYRNAMDAFRIIVKEEKFLGLYKGVTSPLLGVAIMNASVFGCYSLALRAQMGPNTSIDNATLGQIMLAGMASGVMTALITTPIDLLKIRQQNDMRASTSSSTAQVVREIVRRQGITGLFRGYGATCIRDLGYGPYFFTYELLNRTLLSFHSSPAASGDPSTPGPVPTTPPRLSPLELAISGGLAGMVGWAATFWADVIKTRIQATDAPVKLGADTVHAERNATGSLAASRSIQPIAAAGHAAASSSRSSKSHAVGVSETDRLLGSSRTHLGPPVTSSPQRAQVSTSSGVSSSSSGLVSWILRRNEFVRASTEVYRAGGYRAFWVGIGPTMLRALPTNAVLFIVYESTKSALIDWGF